MISGATGCFSSFEPELEENKPASLNFSLCIDGHTIGVTLSDQVDNGKKRPYIIKMFDAFYKSIKEQIKAER